MKKNNFNFRKGFTLVETLVAILVLTLSIGALLSLASSGINASKYSRNQIVANNLMQEALEYIRNSRDTSFSQGLLWDSWQTEVLSVDKYGNSDGGRDSGCFKSVGCYVDPYEKTGENIKECDSRSCPNIFYYKSHGFYGYEENAYINNPDDPVKTSFIRTIKVVPSSFTEDQLIVTASVSWLNGQIEKSIDQSIIIANWRQ